MFAYAAVYVLSDEYGIQDMANCKNRLVQHGRRIR